MTRNIVKTLENGHKIYSTVEMVDGVATGFHTEMDQETLVRKWKPSFQEIAIHSPASQRIGY